MCVWCTLNIFGALGSVPVSIKHRRDEHIAGRMSLLYTWLFVASPKQLTKMPELRGGILKGYYLPAASIPSRMMELITKIRHKQSVDCPARQTDEPTVNLLPSLIARSFGLQS